MPRYRNSRTGVIVLVSDEQAETLGKGYVPADSVEPSNELALFDPSDHKVDEVIEYLAGLDDSEDGEAEAERVLEAERNGKDRKSILDSFEAPSVTENQ